MSTHQLNLSSGRRGSAVAELQRGLAAGGYEITERDSSRSYFGASTAEAVRGFQAEHGLEPTGVVDDRTAAEIARLVAAWRGVFVRVLSEDGLPLAGLELHAEDPLHGREVAEGVTDAQGMFELPVEALGERTNAAGSTLRLHVREHEGADLYEGDVDLAPGDGSVVDVRIGIPMLPAEPSPALTEVVKTLRLKLPKAQLDRLRKRGIKTVADLRDAGGVAAIEGLDRKVAALKALDAQAALSILPTDVLANHALFRAGYGSVLDIAREPQDAFVARVDERLDGDEASTIHEIAGSQARFLGNVATAYRANENGAGTPIIGSSALAATCSCKKCSSAVSPLAYLADLLEYAIRHLKLGRGLKGEYFDTTSFTNLRVTRTDPAVDFDWHEGSPDQLVAPDTFSARWTGQVEPRFSETYTFYTQTSDGARLWVDGQLLVDDWSSHPVTERSGTIALSAGRRYDIKLEYFSGLTHSGNNVARLLWSSSSQPKQVVAQERLHATQGSENLDLDYLQSTFHQPFADLPATCDVVETMVRRVRIGCEILRAYLANTTAPPWYLQRAYELLLTQLGTSFDEIRAARTAASDVRARLAERLGISLPAGGQRPDFLDQLYLDLAGSGAQQLSEQTLETIFGLRATTRNPLDPQQDGGALAQQQLDRLRKTWQQEDWPSPPPAGALPLIDPDVIGPDDLQNPAPPDAAYELWSDRRQWVDLQIALREQARAAGNSFDAILFDSQLGLLDPSSGGTGTHAQELRNLRDQRTQGNNISARVEELGLTSETFDYLVHITDLVAPPASTVLDSEWRDAWAILTEIQKRREFASWRQQERQKGIMVSPRWFKLRPAPLRGGTPAVQDRWLGDPEARRVWTRKLATRTEQEDGVVPAIAAAASTVEEATLEPLRDWLVSVAASTRNFPLDQMADWLSRRLLIDFKAGACQMITRPEQAIETIQGLLFGARNGLLEDEILALDAPSFDEELRWLGSYATWRAAMLVFINASPLHPTLRRRSSPGFLAAIRTLRDAGRITPELALVVAAQYGQYFADVCSLKAAGAYDSLTPLGSDPSAPPGTFTRRLLAVAQAGASGSFYTSAFTRRYKPSIYQGLPPVALDFTAESFWQELPGLPQSSTVMGLFPYQAVPGIPRVALYATSTQDGVTKRYFASTSLEDPPDIEDGRTVGELPGLVRSIEAMDGVVTPAAGQTEGWTVQGSDRIVPVDLDGDGRRELIVLAKLPEADGSRRAALLAEQDGGLVTTWGGRLPSGWDLPPAGPEVMRVSISIYPWHAERLLVVNAGSKQIGMVRRAASGGLEVVGITGNVTGAGGSWQVDPSVLLRSAGIDGDGSSELLAVEYVDSSETNQQGATFEVKATQVTVMRVADGGVSFSSQQELLILPPTDHPLADPADVPTRPRIKDVWGGFVPVPNGVGGQDLLCTTRHQEYSGAGNPLPDEVDTWVGVLRWRPVPSGGFPAHLGFVARHMVGAPGWDWSQKADDRLTPARLPGSGQVVMTTPDQSRIGLLGRAADGRSFQTTFSTPEFIDAIGAAGPWQHKSADSVIPADLDGDGRQEIVIVAADGTKVGVLQLGSDSSTLKVRWADGHVRPPGIEGGAGWRPTAAATYVAADLDGDGCEEIVAITSDGRLGMLRGIPAASASLSKLPSKLGPVGVTLHDIRPKQPGKVLLDRQEQIAKAYAANMVTSADSLERNLPYLDEAYYFLHVELGLRLSAAGFYTAALDWLAAVYDYSLPVSARKIAYLLIAEESAPLSFTRADDWLTDPLNPHAIAATRPNAYTRFTKQQVARCIIAFADTLYTHGTSEALTPAGSGSSGTSEALAKAWELYLKALELLSGDDLRGPVDACREVIGTLEIQVGDDRWINAWKDVIDDVSEIRGLATLTTTAEALVETMETDAPLPDRIARAREIVSSAREEEPAPAAFSKVLAQERTAERDAHAAVLSSSAVALAARRLGAAKGVTFAPIASNGSRMLLASHGNQIGWKNSSIFDTQFVPAPKYSFCIPADPAVEALRKHAELALRKMRSCRNIAGIPMHVDPYAAPITVDGDGEALSPPRPAPLQPLPYPYPVLVERSRQLLALAAQAEQSLQAALEKQSEDAYTELKARQDLGLTRAGVRLKELQFAEAEDGVEHAQLGLERAQMMEKHYSDLINAGLNPDEIAGLAASGIGVAGKFVESAIAEGMGAGDAFLAAGNLLMSAASYERRAEEWVFQRSLAERDIPIEGSQVLLASDQVLIAGQEQAISQLQYEGAEAVMDFIATKRFGSAAMREWMVAVNEPISAYLLNEATSMAKLAEAQLRFERQQPMPVFIADDYWEPPQDLAAAQTLTSEDTHGLTGSARLERDLVALDEFAFQTDQRKLQLTKTISLAEADPYAFQRFRETGVLRFATPMSLFERDFPDHYLRLIKRVRTSLVALTPPAAGIRATLSTTGNSRVVTAGDSFQTVTVQRPPESVALSSPWNSTGLFELDVQPELRVPFADGGVDQWWQFVMAKAANPMVDHNSIADLLFTVEYTALSAADYGTQVLERLDRDVGADRTFSFRNELQDAWFDLHNPDQAAKPMEVEFLTGPADFPPNLEGVTIQQVALIFSPASGEVPASWAQDLRTGISYKPDGGALFRANVDAKPVNGVISTRGASGSPWAGLKGLGVRGSWRITLHDDPATRAIFAAEELGDILFVVTYGGTLPPWPAAA